MQKSKVLENGIKGKEDQIKNTLIYLLPVVLTNLLPIVTLPIFTRVLTKEDYGVLALAHVYGAFMAGLANFGLLNIYNRNFFNYRDSRNRAELLYSLMLFGFSSLLVCGAFTFHFKIPVSKWIIGSDAHSALVFWTFCSVGLINLRSYYSHYFINSELAKTSVRYTLGESVLAVLFSLWFVVFLRVGVIGLVWGPLAATSIVFCALTVRFLRSLSFALSGPIFKSSLKLAYPLAPNIFGKVISNQFDKYMIGLMSTVGSVGIYGIGQRVAYLVFMYMTAIENVFIPRVYKRMFDSGKKGGEAIGIYLTPFVYISIAVGLAVSFFAEEAIIILTPVSFHGAIEIVMILAMFYGSLFFGKLPQLIYAKKTFVMTILNYFRILLNISLNIPFIIYWGAVGAAWATLLAGLISGVVGFAVSQHFYTIQWEYRKVGAIFLVFFVFSILVLLMRNADTDYLFRLGVKMIGVFFFTYIGIKTRILTLDNLLLIKKAVGGIRYGIVQKKSP
ncbi:MAG: polysaccharide biosynthesis protein [Deltaproteobacteria bacterium]|nr:polysaccharide biosynthesis protein [Deltaproteobacteria bacterium]